MDVKLGDGKVEFIANADIEPGAKVYIYSLSRSEKQLTTTCEYS